jgi:hypothetical protein
MGTAGLNVGEIARLTRDQYSIALSSDLEPIVEADLLDIMHMLYQFLYPRR